MDSKDNKSFDDDEEIIEEKELDKEAFDVIKRLYAGTFRDLVDRYVCL